MMKPKPEQHKPQILKPARGGCFKHKEISEKGKHDLDALRITKTGWLVLVYSSLITIQHSTATNLGPEKQSDRDLRKRLIWWHVNRLFQWYAFDDGFGRLREWGVARLVFGEPVGVGFVVDWVGAKAVEYVVVGKWLCRTRSTCGELDVVEVESIGCLDRRRIASIVTMVRTIARWFSMVVPGGFSEAVGVIIVSEALEKGVSEEYLTVKSSKGSGAIDGSTFVVNDNDLRQ
ncbi:hypothetical protein Tco_1119415 [Tanacetum coccineum]